MNNATNLQFAAANGNINILIIKGDMIYFFAKGWNLERALYDIMHNNSANEDIYYTFRDLADGCRYYLDVIEDNRELLSAVPMSLAEYNRLFDMVARYDGLDTCNK